MISDAFIGLVCDYVIAPIGRYAAVWRIPLITANLQLDETKVDKDEFKTLTRMMGSHSLVAQALLEILKGFGWKVSGLLYHNNQADTNLGNSNCHFTLGTVYGKLNKTSVYKDFDEKRTEKEQLKDILRYLTKSARSKLY